MKLPGQLFVWGGAIHARTTSDDDGLVNMLVTAFRISTCALALSAFEAPSAQRNAPPPNDQRLAFGRDLADALRADARYRTFGRMAWETGVADYLRTAGPDSRGFTVFAPSDAAFAALARPVRQALESDRELLIQVLRHHVTPGASVANSLPAGRAAQTVSGDAVPVTKNGNQIQFGEARIIATDHRATNGIIHSIDRVLLPPAVVRSLIDRDVLPRGTTPAASARAQVLDASDLSVIIPQRKDAATLTRLIQRAGLADQLRTGSYTVLVPTDEAFEELPKLALAALETDRELLRSVIHYHILPGRIMHRDLRSGTVNATSGDSIVIKIGSGGAAKFNEAVLLDRDIAASNGVAHTVSRVLLPKKAMAAMIAKGITFEKD